MSADDAFDVAIAGGALVGAALARGLRGMRVALIAQERPAPPPEAAGFDARVYAISPGNAEFLSRLGVWSAIPQGRMTQVRAMRVYGDDGESLIEFDAYRSGCSELAWIVEDRQLQAALWTGLEQQDGLTLLCGASLDALDIGPEQAGLFLEDGRGLELPFLSNLSIEMKKGALRPFFYALVPSSGSWKSMLELVGGESGTRTPDKRIMIPLL